MLNAVTAFFIAMVIIVAILNTVNKDPNGPENRAVKACNAYREHLSKSGEHYSMEYFAQEYNVSPRMLREWCK